MKFKKESTARNIARSLSMGILFSLLFLYLVHVFGTWKVENYRPDDQTTYTVLLHNTCALFGKEHVLRPNTDVSQMGEGIDGTKLSGSFMNFTDGHILHMIIITLFAGGIIFFIRRRIQTETSNKTDF